MQGVQRAHLGDCQQPVRCVGRRGRELRLGGGQRPGSSARRVRCQFGRPLQERGRGGDTSSGGRAVGGFLEFVGDIVIGAERGVGAVPGPAIRVGVRIGLVGERAVGRAAIVDVGGEVGGRAHQRMAEADPGADLDESLGLCMRGVVGVIPIRCAARINRALSPTGSAAAASNSFCVGAGSDLTRRTKLCSR